MWRFLLIFVLTAGGVMDSNFIAQTKEKLLNQRKTILASLAGQNNDIKDLVKPVASGDEADMAGDVMDRTLLGSLGAQDAQLLKQIDSALDRIRLNKYGICLGCGQEIPQARLEALPYALMCISCATREERKKR